MLIMIIQLFNCLPTCDLNPTELILAKIMRLVHGNITGDVNFQTLLKGSKDLDVTCTRGWPARAL
jgi:hypothetical protein